MKTRGELIAQKLRSGEELTALDWAYIRRMFAMLGPLMSQVADAFKLLLTSAVDAIVNLDKVISELEKEAPSE